MTRARLPDRRPNLSLDLEWRGHRFVLCAGFDPSTGALREVFASTLKGGDMAATVADACVTFSLQLQAGHRVVDMGRSYAREPDPYGRLGVCLAGETPRRLSPPEDAPASVLGAILDVLAAIEGGRL
ncbi:MAG: hypothetical protein ACK4S2_07035 [Gemmobacter sp.]|uniref:hypothetical protein n=1 Tax=Gemmobacter sp. TaxID=1898957 RepID=UPI00391D4BC2